MIVPLTKRKTEDGTLYTRPANIEAQLAILVALSRDQILERCLIKDKKHPDYVHSECLVSLIRAARSDNSNAWFERLYKHLDERVLQGLPKSGKSDGPLSITIDRIRNDVFDRFVQLLAEDKTNPGDKLDFFEIRFDMALKRLRQDAQEKAWRDENRTEGLENELTGEVSQEVEAAALAAGGEGNSLFSDPLFRDKLYKAIDRLPPEQSRVMHLLLQEWPVHSSDPNVMTIAKALGCSDRTVRNYRDRAIATLTALFNDRNDQ